MKKVLGLMRGGLAETRNGLDGSDMQRLRQGAVAGVGFGGAFVVIVLLAIIMFAPMTARYAARSFAPLVEDAAKSAIRTGFAEFESAMEEAVERERAYEPPDRDMSGYRPLFSD